jgi:hypothetical protein
MGESGNIIEGRHFRDKLKKEEIKRDDAFYVMRAGNIYEAPELDIVTGELKWKVEGLEPDGRWIVVVFVFKTVENAFLVTIYSVESRRR